MVGPGEDGPGRTLPDQPSAPADPWIVPPPAAAAGAPPPPRRRGWRVALLAVLSLTVAMAVAGTVLFITRTLPPYNAARHFLDDVTHDRATAAGVHLCSADAASPEGIIQAVRSRVGGGVHSISANPLGVDRSGGTATVDFTVTYSDGRSGRSFSLAVREEHGTWKACPASG
jgi:hypothetical protein